jgi:hypothetical protein
MLYLCALTPWREGAKAQKREGAKAQKRKGV